MIVDLASWSSFYFAKVVEVAIGLTISPTINKIVSTSIKIIINFFTLFLW